MSATLSGRIELFERNLTVSAFAGHGRDRVTPHEPPPGQAEMWPASHFRVYGGASVSQLLSPSAVAHAGAAVSAQRGVLANPYRRTLVRTTLFPEILPDARNRVTVFGQLGWHVGWNTAVHLRQGLYVDSWDVIALIPEGQISSELGHGVIVGLGYRFYRQWGAGFRQAQYQDIEDIMTSDPRLGDLSDHTLCARARWQINDRWELLAAYALSRLAYGDAGRASLIGHVVDAGLTAHY